MRLHLLFDIQRTVHRDISYNKSQLDALFLKFIFDKELYMFRTDLLSIIRSLNTVYAAIGICHASYVDSAGEVGVERRVLYQK